MDRQLVTTYRYLRLSLVTVLALLAFAVALEMAGGTFEPSVSDYFWTPVRSVFVGALVALGVGMVVIKPDNELEDIFLSVGGVLSLVVAFVPTPEPGTCTTAHPSLPAGIVSGVTNNIAALLLAGALAFAVFLVLTRGSGRPRTPVPPSVRRARLVGTGVTGVLLVAGFGWFEADRPTFDCGAHVTAALLLFAAIIGVAVLNAVTRTLEKRADGVPLARAVRNRYSVVVALIAVVLVATVPLAIGGYRYAVLLVEAGVLLLFLVFWIMQSAELWDSGRRGGTDAGAATVLPRSRGSARP